MSDAFWNSLAPTILAGASLVAALRANRAAQDAKTQSSENAKGIAEVHVATNSMKDELVKVTGEKAFAEGVLAQKEHFSEPVKVEVINPVDDPVKTKVVK